MRNLLFAFLLFSTTAFADVSIPGSIRIAIDPEDLVIDAYSAYTAIPGNESKTREEFIASITGPAGSGGGAVRQVKFSSIAAGATTSSVTYISTGLSIDITPNSSTNKLLLQVNGYAGNSSPASINRFTLFRKIGSGSFVELTPASHTGMGGTRTTDSGYCDPFSFNFVDEPNTTQQITYELRWNAASGTGYLGQRPDGTAMKYPTTIVVSEMQ
jgi:hypothetical protein